MSTDITGEIRESIRAVLISNGVALCEMMPTITDLAAVDEDLRNAGDGAALRPAALMMSAELASVRRSVLDERSVNDLLRIAANAAARRVFKLIDEHEKLDQMRKVVREYLVASDAFDAAFGDDVIDQQTLRRIGLKFGTASAMLRMLVEGDR